MLIKNINPNKLHDELISANFVPLLVEHDRLEGENIAENTWITFEDGTDMELVQQIIDAHAPTPLPPKPTELEIQQEIINALGQELTLLKLQFMMGGM